MNVLMITRKVDKDDWLAGFVYGWIQSLARDIGGLKVISMEEGNAAGLPNNVEVYFVGKKNLSRFERFRRFREILKSNKPHVDLVFLHMHPIYAILAKFIGPRRFLVLWYTHKNVDFKL